MPGFFAFLSGVDVEDEWRASGPGVEGEWRIYMSDME